ncbi:phage tail assembly protein [Bacillus badius]|uniref:phage tail assembly protein n=1 Tax=Bacillus badius TaxID=1455 RepID=UPI001CC06373|nr:phage tail assembly protein [Bacillus badius]UAT29504.1 phage tail assembly protein [Bacillus badius]
MTNPILEKADQVQNPEATATFTHPIQEMAQSTVTAPVVDTQPAAAVDKDGEVVFKKPYTFEGTEYKSIDLSGIEDLTSNDLLKADQVYSEKGGFSPAPELTMQFAFIIAAQAAKLPIEFFNNLPARDGLKVKNMVVRFLNN